MNRQALLRKPHPAGLPAGRAVRRAARTALPFLIASACLATPARATDTPQPASADSRVRWVVYNEDEVFRLQGVFRAAMQILFADDEAVQHVALGDTTSWEIAPAGNILFLKPREAAGPTNLIVTTKGPNGFRNYQFELSARSGALSSAIFQVRFRYPDDEKRRLAAAVSIAAQRKAALIEAGAVRLALDGAVMSGQRNLRYLLNGNPELQPSEVTDNGLYTVLRFPRGQALPSFYTVNPDGSEAIIPFDVRDDFVVIHGTYRQLRLRRGDALLCIWNDAYEPYGQDTSSGTASPDVIREIGGGSGG